MSPQPEQTNIQETLSPEDQLFSDIQAQPQAELIQVTMNATSHEIGQPLTEQGTINSEKGVEQDLFGVVKAGDELFGVVKTKAKDLHHPEQAETTKFVLTRFGKDGERATVVSVLDNVYPVTVGRTHQEGLSKTTSKDHFRIGINGDNLVIEDLGSTNGTKLLMGRDVQKEVTQPQPEGRFGMRALKRAHDKLKANPETDKIVEDPLTDFKTWAPNSQEMKIAVLSSRVGIYVDRPRVAPQSIPVRRYESQPVRDQEPDPRVERFANDSRVVESTMSEVVKALLSHEGQKFELSDDDLVVLFGVNDFISRSILASLQDAKSTGVILKPEVQEALRSAFDLPVLQTNTMPSDLEWGNENAVIQHAALIQSKLHGVEREERLKYKESQQWPVPDTTQRLSNAFAVLSDAIARNPSATRLFNSNYHAGNMKTPLHLSERLKKQLETLRVN